MGFRVFDVLYACVLVLAAVAAAAAFYLVEPYPAVIVAAFAAGAATFLYLTVRVKLGGIVATVDRRLDEQEAEAARHREALEQSFADIEHLTRTMREQIKAMEEKNLREADVLRKNVGTVIGKFNGELEKMGATAAGLKKAVDADVEKIAALEREQLEAAELLKNLADDLNAFVADEHTFRDNIESRLKDRVAYLEDFIREKRKSLQI
jgi:hypothetical protein